MNDIELDIKKIENAFSIECFPEGFLDKYVQLECLSNLNGSECFLVQNKENKELFIAKCYDKRVYLDIKEHLILKSLSHPGLPRFIDDFQNDSMICVVREYVIGQTLEEYCLENRLSRHDAIDISIKLCDILIYIQEQKKAIIHRDIKPQNIIIRADKTICLIDFGISRIYSESSKNDTQFIGTRNYAAPEQYGFSQTDSRTDIYSVGVVIAWLFTGLTDSGKVMNSLSNRKLLKIYKKCTSFSPDRRYANARELKKALINFDRQAMSNKLKLITVVLLCVVFLILGFYIGRYTDLLEPTIDLRKNVEFKEALIERAVRIQLGKDENESITQEELLLIKGIYIFGDSLCAKNEEELHTKAKQMLESNQMQVGMITCLDDISLMPNLNQLFICMQKIIDVSQLACLKKLEVLDIKNNPISDISALAKLKSLRRVTLFDTEVTDLSPLSGCLMLVDLDAGKLPIHSLTAFNTLKGLRSLRIFGIIIDSLAGIEEFTELEVLELEVVVDGELSRLLELKKLKSLCLGENLRTKAVTQLGKANFSILYR